MTRLEAFALLSRIREKPVHITPVETVYVDDCLKALMRHDRFVGAALEFCRLWTRDARNALDAAKVQGELDRARARLWEAYQDLGKANPP